ncbi:hypothetical protein HK100_010012, partial [Physocladia obscura]
MLRSLYKFKNDAPQVVSAVSNTTTTRATIVNFHRPYSVSASFPRKVFERINAEAVSNRKQRFREKTSTGAQLRKSASPRPQLSPPPLQKPRTPYLLFLSDRLSDVAFADIARPLGERKLDKGTAQKFFAQMWKGMSADEKKPPKKLDTEPSKKPMSSFFLFSKEKRAEFKSTSNPPGQLIMKKIGEAWKNLSEKEKQ